MMQRRKIKSLCVQETRCKGNKAKILAEGYKLLYSSESPESRNGVGVILHRKLQEEVCEVNKVNDTVMYVKMMFGREMVTVLTAYASEAGCSEDGKEKFWRDLDGVMVGVPENERVIVGGDLNGHVGGRKESVQEWWKIDSAVIRKTGEEVFWLTSGRGVPEDKEAWWWNEEVQKVVKEKKDAKRKWDMSRSAEDGQAYKRAKKEAKRAVAKAKAESVREAYEQLQKNQDMRQLIWIGKSRDKASKDLTAIKQMKDEIGIILHGHGKIIQMWLDYFEKLLNEENVRVKTEEGGQTKD
ncbi:uncharacterized protein LOC124605931 [Schistocerca americana]|uniref:uncharacterized protein LOC124605931 n=1 Tax=Schistocerca americana TaxID=7009 RepID=UPI001F500CD8|nr:uncharacterized protein LOC124605931 [Schistocerca americana]